MGVVLTIPLYGIVLYFYYFTMSETPIGTPEMQATVESVHDPVVMAEAMREDLKNLEEKARHYAMVVKGKNCLPMFDQ